MSCTTPECGRGTSLYLCTTCILELDTLLKDVPFFFEGLDPVNQAKKVIKGPGNEGANGTRHGKSKPPLDLDAGQLRSNLAMLPKRAYEVATQDPEAGRTLVMARDWIRKAELLVYGPERKKARDKQEVQAIIQDKIPDTPMRIRELTKWLYDGYNLIVEAATIRKWSERELITRTNKGEYGPTYKPADVLLVAKRHH